MCPDQARASDAGGDPARFVEITGEGNRGPDQTTLRVVGEAVLSGGDRE